MRPEAQFVVHQWAQFSDKIKVVLDQDVKHIIKYLKGTATQALITKIDPEKGINWYFDADFAIECDQDKVTDYG